MQRGEGEEVFMSIKYDILSYIKKEGLSVVEVNDKLNERHDTNKHRQALYKKIDEGIKHKDVIEIADILGYDIEWIKRK